MIGSVLRKFRISKGLKQADVANTSGVGQPYLSLIESGKKIPTNPTINKIAKAIEVPFSVVIWMSVGEEDVPKEKQEAFLKIKPYFDSLIKTTFDL